ncbi:MAG: sugar transferase [Flavobacteriales bacterium]|nr:sugar transferase [Flavobacteriales bacterium]
MVHNIFKSYPKYKWFLALVDLLVLNTAFFLSVYLISFFKGTEFEAYARYITPVPEWKLFALYSLGVVLYYQYANLYKIQNIVNQGRHYFLLFKTSIFLIVGYILLQFLLKDIQISSRLFYLVLFLVMNILLFLIRIPLVDVLKGNVRLSDRVVVIGSGAIARKLVDLFDKNIRFKNVVGYVDDNGNTESFNGLDYLGSIEDIEAVRKEHKVDYFILAIDNLSRSRFFEIFGRFQDSNIPIHVNSQYLQVLYDHLEIDYYDELGLVRFASHDDNRFLHYTKRLFDIAFALVAIFLFSPLFLVIGMAVLLTSKGPIIYKQVRIGKDGKPFYFYKFRSMYVNSDKDPLRSQKVADFIKGDYSPETGSTKVVNKSNITPVGAIIRKFSLDELPQLVNVLLGNMSLVGPRPCVPGEWKIYEDWQKLRLKSIPGCTGIWQVSGRSKVDFEDSVLMDIYYNQNFTPWVDLKLILRTIPVMVLGKGGE